MEKERSHADSRITQRAPVTSVHRLVAIARNGWSRSIGTAGRDQSEQVVSINRNRWSRSSGARSDLGLDRLGQQSTRAITQDFGELIVDVSWLNQLDDVIFGHGISLLRWRSGGVKHPHDMPPFRFPPSPTLGDSSVKEATANYPFYDRPHKQKPTLLYEAQENFDYFMRVRLDRLALFQSWLMTHFDVNASLDRDGASAASRWVDRYGDALLGDLDRDQFSFPYYSKSWTKGNPGYSVIFDLGIFIGEFVIEKRPWCRWALMQETPDKPSIKRSISKLQPSLFFCRKWELDESDWSCLACSLRRTCRNTGGKGW